MVIIIVWPPAMISNNKWKIINKFFLWEIYQENFEHFTNRSLIYPQKCQSPKRRKKKNQSNLCWKGHDVMERQSRENIYIHIYWKTQRDLTFFYQLEKDEISRGQNSSVITRIITWIICNGYYSERHHPVILNSNVFSAFWEYFYIILEIAEAGWIILWNKRNCMTRNIQT